MTLKFGNDDDQDKASHAREVPSTTSNQGERDQQIATLPSHGGETSRRSHPGFGSLCLPGSTVHSQGVDSKPPHAVCDEQSKRDTQNRSTDADVTEYDPKNYSHNASEFVKSEVANSQRAFAEFAAQRAANKQAKD